jgi:hypothetical protein
MNRMERIESNLQLVRQPFVSKSQLPSTAAILAEQIQHEYLQFNALVQLLTDAIPLLLPGAQGVPFNLDQLLELGILAKPAVWQPIEQAFVALVSHKAYKGVLLIGRVHVALQCHVIDNEKIAQHIHKLHEDSFIEVRDLIISIAQHALSLQPPTNAPRAEPCAPSQAQLAPSQAQLAPSNNACEASAFTHERDTSGIDA